MSLAPQAEHVSKTLVRCRKRGFTASSSTSGSIASSTNSWGVCRAWRVSSTPITPWILPDLVV
jgi:hypothetical protein